MIFSLILACAVALIFFFLVEKKNLRFLLIFLGVLPVLGIYLNNSPRFRLVPFHGFMHTSIVYKIMEGQWPPLNIFAAGERLIYPWGYHTVCAIISTLFKVAPPWSSIVINLLAMAALLFILYRISYLLKLDGVGCALGAVTAVYALSPYFLFIQKEMGVLFYSPDIFRRPLLPILKFINATGMTLGITLTFLIILLTLHYFMSKDFKAQVLVYFVITFVALGFIYPLLLMPLLVGLGILACLSFLEDRKKAVWFSIGSAIGCVLMAPYLYHLIGLNPETVGIRLIFKLKNIALTTGAFIILLSPLALIILYERWKSKVSLPQNKKGYYYLLPFLVGMMAVAYFMEGERYKFMMMAAMIVGLLSGRGWGYLFQRNKWICFVMFVFFLAPSVNQILLRSHGYRPETKSTFRSHGIQIFHPERVENNLNRWIRKNTAIEDLFIDVKFSIPAFTGRSLYMGYSEHRVWGYGKSTVFLKGGLVGTDQEIIDERRKIKTQLFNQEHELSKDFFRGLLDSLGESLANVYVVARNEETQKRFAKSSELIRKYYAQKIAVYKLEKRTYE